MFYSTMKLVLILLSLSDRIHTIFLVNSFLLEPHYFLFFRLIEVKNDK